MPDTVASVSHYLKHSSGANDSQPDGGGVQLLDTVSRSGGRVMKEIHFYK